LGDRGLEIRIRELKPELAAEYLKFFDDVYDNDPWLRYSNNPWWGGCYCAFYDDLRTEEEIDASKDKRSENRALRKETIEAGRGSGLLAYSGEEVVGWCNVAPRYSYANPRFMVRATDDRAEKVGSISCFVVSSGWRGRGIATNLLRQACGLIGKWGLPVAEGYPPNPNPNVSGTEDIPMENLNYHGSLNMFLRAGFHVHREIERLMVVRKTL
jgi:GNAT superfamily N-acetyltransferase